MPLVGVRVTLAELPRPNDNPRTRSRAARRRPAIPRSHPFVAQARPVRPRPPSDLSWTCPGILAYLVEELEDESRILGQEAVAQVTQTS